MLNTVVAVRMSETSDEPYHVGYGVAILKGSPDRLQDYNFDSKMPVSILNAVPRAAGKWLAMKGHALRIAGILRDFHTARFPTLIAAFGLSLLVYLFAESLYGRVAGLSAQFLCIISPNLIAHGSLATTDLYVAAATVLFLYSFRQFLLRPGLPNAFFAGSTLALAQLTKFTALLLYPAAAVVLISVLLYSKLSRRDCYRVSHRQLAALLAIHIVCFLVLINAGFGFDRTFTPLARYQFASPSFQRAQRVPLLSSIPLPVPYPYLQGFDLMAEHNAEGSAGGNIVLLGDVRGPALARSDGFPSYYLVAYALKVPLGMQLLLLLGLLWTARHRRLEEFLTGEWLLLATAAAFLLMLSFFSKTQIGIRHVLPVLALFIILSGGAFADFLSSSRRQRILLGACLLWTVVSVGSYYPQMIPYFNEIVMNRKMAYRYLADSNLDWGQAAQLAHEFLKSHPDVVFDPPQPVYGRILVDANLMAGVAPPKADYWLRRMNAQPIAQVGYAYLLFSISPKRIQQTRVSSSPAPFP